MGKTQCVNFINSLKRKVVLVLCIFLAEGKAPLYEILLMSYKILALYFLYGTILAIFHQHSKSFLSNDPKM